MDFRKVQALRGPNIWAAFPVLEAWVDLGTLRNSPSDEIPGFNERLMAWLPSLIEHRCSVGKRGGFFERLRRGTWQAHILEHVVLELQTLAGTAVGFGRTRETSEDGVYKVAIEYEDEDLARAALEAGRELCLAAVHDRPFDMMGTLFQLRELVRQTAVEPALAAIVQAAAKRHIPVCRVGGQGLLRLGHGARQRRFAAGQTDRTGALAQAIAADPALSRELLRAVGVPVAEDPPVGTTWRLLVVGGRLVTATCRETGVDVTPVVHAEVTARVVDAAHVIGLDVAGIEVVATDLGRPLEEQGGAVVAVDGRPELGLYLRPTAGLSRPIGEAIVGRLFPEGQTGRIPLVGITGVNGKTTTTRLVAHIVARTQRCVGMTCTEGIYVDGRRIEVGDCSGPQSAAAVLQNPLVEAAVLETARGGILRAGLGFDRCDVAVVTNIDEGDHLGVADIDTPEQLARVKRVLVEAVAPTGAAVLNATDPLVAAMAPYCPGAVVFFAQDGSHPIVARHRAGRGRAVFVEDHHIVLAEGDQEIPLVSIDLVPLTHGGRVAFQVENALAAAGAAWSLGIPCEAIRVGLQSFHGDLKKTPGRFNLFDINGATVIVDYGHNAASLARMIETLGQFPHPRRLVVYSTAGDRRDCDLVRLGELLGSAFDHVVLFEDHYLRGRHEGEIIGLFRRGLAAGPRVTEVQEVRGSVAAIKAGLAAARSGDLILLQADTVEETVEFVQRHLAVVGGREIDLAEVLGAPHHETMAVTCAPAIKGTQAPDRRRGKGVHAVP
jgi:cyanophycin synthetase